MVSCALLFSNPLGERGALVDSPFRLCGFLSALETSFKSFALGTTEEGFLTQMRRVPSRQRQVGHGATALPLTLSTLPRILEWEAWC